MQRLQGKVAIITGAAGTIGQAVAVLFAREGARLVLAGAAPSERASRLLADVQGLGATAAFVYGDVREEATARHTVEVAVRAHDRLDVLVNNAGVALESVVPETAAADFDRLTAINVRGPMLMMKHALPPMARSGGGSIVNVASRLALVGVRTQAIYGSTKGALMSMTRSVALDHAGQNVRVNCVCPGPIDGPMMREWFQAQENPADFERHMVGAIPMGRLGAADEVARAILFLASDESAYITGVALPVDGGYTAA